MAEKTRKKTGPRCRTIGGVVYDLTATDRPAPCRRASSASRPSVKAPAKPAPKPAPSRSFRTPLRSNDLRVLEREEREREHRRREQLAVRPVERTQLAGVGRLPKPKPEAPALKLSERAVVEKVRKRNRAGLLYQPDATTPSLNAIAHALVKRGVLLEHGHNAFYVPEHAGDLERMSAASARLRGKPAAPAASVGVASNRSVSDFDLRRRPVTKLPLSIDPSKARKGDRVSVFDYAGNEPSHAVLIGLPGDAGSYGAVETEPSVHFESGSNAGMNRHVRWERVFPGWLDPNVNWKPWKG